MAIVLIEDIIDAAEIINRKILLC